MSSISRIVNVNNDIYQVRRSKYTVNESAVIVSDNMSGKMEGIPAISTSPIYNTFCKARCKDDKAICSKCYSIRTAKRYSALDVNLKTNYIQLTSGIIPAELLPKFKESVTIARFEAFGDLQNENQLENYINICRINPHVMFAIWTKNAWIVKIVCDKIGKPENLNIIESSPYINDERKPNNEYIDSVFTVYDHAYINKNNINIQCGSRDCMSCRRCYTKHNEFFTTNEKLK